MMTQCCNFFYIDALINLILVGFYGILIVTKYILQKGTIQMTNQAKLKMLSRIRMVFIILAVLLLAASAVTGWMAFNEAPEMTTPETEPETTAPRRESKYEDDDFEYTFPSTTNTPETEETYQNPYYNTAPTSAVPNPGPGYQPPATEAPTKPTQTTQPTEATEPERPPEDTGFTTAPTLPPETTPPTTQPPATQPPETAPAPPPAPSLPPEPNE